MSSAIRVTESVGALDVVFDDGHLLITQDGIDGSGDQYISVPQGLIDAFIAAVKEVVDA